MREAWREYVTQQGGVMEAVSTLYAVEQAVRADHPPNECGVNTCDISAALRYGFPTVAAYLLAGATETPALDALPDDIRATFLSLTRYRSSSEWQQWVEAFHANAVECDACGSFAFPDQPGDPAPVQCGNCLADLEHHD